LSEFASAASGREIWGMNANLVRKLRASSFSSRIGTECTPTVKMNNECVNIPFLVEVLVSERRKRLPMTVTALKLVGTRYCTGTINVVLREESDEMWSGGNPCQPRYAWQEENMEVRKISITQHALRFVLESASMGLHKARTS